MRLRLALPSHHERLVGEWTDVKEIEIFRSCGGYKFGATWVTLCEVTDAVTTQKGGEARTSQTCLTDDGRILQQLLVHQPQYLSRLVAI